MAARTYPVPPDGMLRFRYFTHDDYIEYKQQGSTIVINNVYVTTMDNFQPLLLLFIQHLTICRFKALFVYIGADSLEMLMELQAVGFEVAGDQKFDDLLFLGYEINNE